MKKLDRSKITPRYVAYLVCLSSAYLLCIYWSDRHDWIKIPIILEIQFGSFEMFISRQSLDLSYPVMMVSFSTTLYCIFSYSIWAPPTEPTPAIETIALEFNISAIGECQLSQGSQVCFGDGAYGFFRSDYEIEVFDDQAVNIVETLSTVRNANDGDFGLTDEQWEQCKIQMYRVGCGSFQQMCDYSCKSIQMCHDICQATLDACGTTIVDLFDAYSPIIVSIAASVGISEEEANVLVNAFSNTAKGCNNVYANESESLCMSNVDMYETNLTGISPDGACTPENAVRYEQYLESLNTESFDSYLEAVEQYHEDIESVNSRKTLFSLALLLGTSFFEYFVFFLPQYGKDIFDVRYASMSNYISGICRVRIIFMGILAGFLCFILRSTVLQLELTAIYSALILLCAIWSGYTAIVALFHQDRIAYQFIIKERDAKSNSVQNMEKSHTTLVLKLLECLRWYNKNFSNSGKYEYWKYIVSEVVEIALQLNVMLSLAKTEDFVSVLANIIIISINLIVSPLLLLHPSPAIWRTLNRVSDSFLDIAYLTLLYFTLTSRSDDIPDSTSEAVLGILLPALRLTIRLYSLIRSVLRDFTKTEILSNSEIQGLSPNRINNKTRIAIIIVFVSCGLSLLSSTIYRIASKNQQCTQEIGEDAWQAIENRVLFPDGLLHDSSCSFESVRLLNMSHSSLTEISSSLTKLVNLEVLDLSNNNLTTIPYELSRFNLLTTLNVTGNPVSIRLDWSGLGIEYYPYEVLSLIGTLEKLDLSNNSFSSIDDWGESRLLSLTELDLSMNKLTMISANYIQSLNSLILLNLSHNKLQGLEESIWSMISLKNLDVSYNLFTEVPSVWATRKDGFVAEVEGNSVTSIDWSLSLSGRTIFFIPDQLSDLENLTSFTATGQQIVNLGGLVSLNKLQLLNLSYGLVIPYREVCKVKIHIFLDFSYSADPQVFNGFECVTEEFVPNEWNISGFPMDFMTHPDSPVLSWIHAEHIVANNLLKSSYTNMSIVMSALTKLRILTVRNSPITALDRVLIPQNLTYLDLRNTSMTMDHVQLNLPGFNCTYPTPYVCTRTL